MKHLLPRLLTSALVLAFGVICVSVTHAQEGLPFSDDFDSYANGTVLDNINGWKGWDNTPGAAGTVSDAQANSSPHSVAIAPNIDAVNELGNPTTGKWDITTNMYIPTGFTGPGTGQYYIMLNVYNDGSLEPKTWAVQLQFDPSTGLLDDNYDPGGFETPYILDQWVPLRVIVDLENDTVDQYYNGEVINEGQQWSTRNGQGEIAIGAVDLFSDNSTTIYWDDYSMAVFVDTPVTVVAETLDVMPGVIAGGGLPELEDSDNMDLRVFRDPIGINAVTQFVLTATSPTASPSAFEFTLEGNVVSRPNVVQRIEFWDYVAGAWETVDEQNANRTPNPDLTVTAAGTGDLSRFVDQATNEIMTRIRYRADIARAQFASNTDQAVWNITP